MTVSATPEVNLGETSRRPETPDIEPILPLSIPLEPRSSAPPSLCVVIPVFNEEAVLARLHEELCRVLDQLDAKASILFVNDGSRDGTSAVLEALYQRDRRVSYLLLSRNFGHQAALTAGLDHADADIVVSMDADLQHPPALLVELFEAWRQGFDVVHTSKLVTKGLSPVRSFTTRIAYRLISRVSQVDIIPQASDFRLLDRTALEAIRALPEKARLYRGLTPWVGFRQCVVRYVAPERAAGTSQYGFKQLLGLFMRAFFDFSDAPLHIGLLIGTAAVGLSTLYLMFILLWLILGEDTPPGWASSVSVTLLLNSITLAFLGIIGVYVARIYNEVRSRPPYVLSRVRTRAGERP
ncbi:MAG: glycosyltransferase family 2 protein [Gemmatimonadaceae bacterium]